MHKWIIGHKMSGVQMILRNLLLDAMYSADRKYPGSGVYVPYCIFNSVKEHPIRSSSSYYRDIILEMRIQQSAKDLFSTVFDACGPLTKIILKPSHEHDTIVKYRNKFNFPLSVDPQFERMLGARGTLEQTNPIVIMIEGAPETIAEIDPLLQWNHSSGRPVILVARHFPEEVSATLATNWLRGSLNIMPMSYGSSIETINLAADLCAVTKGELISPHFGDLITSSILDEDKWGTVDTAQYASGTLSIEKSVNVDRHIRSLLERMNSAEEEEVKDIYRNRILSLSNDAIEIWIHKENTDLIETFDGVIKHYNGFVTSGVVTTPAGAIPKCFLDSAQECAQSFRNEILNIGGFLVGVKDEVVAG